MSGVLPAPLAVLRHFYFPLHQLFVLAGVVINPVADRAFELY